MYAYLLLLIFMHGFIAFVGRDSKGENKFDLIMEQSQNIILPENYKVLLAEDNPINQRVALLTLKRIGIPCDVANNGIEAVSLYKENLYNLIFMDMQMPMLDGVGATLQIREFESQDASIEPVYIIAVTANSFTNDREECFNAGMNEFINKPFSEGILRKVIQKAIDNHQNSESYI